MKGATAVAAMIALPVAASAAPVRSAEALSVASSVRADAAGEGENGQFFEGGFILPVIIVVAVGLGLYFALQEDDDAVSP